MSNNYCIFNDFQIIRYQKTTTLFKLDKLPLKKLLKDFRLASDKVEFSEESIKAIQKILLVIQSDTIMYQEIDVKITVGLELTKKGDMIIKVWSKQVIFPFDSNEKTIYISIPLDKLNVMTTYSLPEASPLSSSLNNELFRTLKKIDSFLDYNNELYQLVIDNGVYPRLTRPSMSLFELEYNENTFTIQSKLKGFFESDYDLSFFKLNVYNRRVSILLAGQFICLTEREFLDTPNKDIMDIVTSLMKIKNVPIASMSNLKDYLLTQDMKNI